MKKITLLFIVSFVMALSLKAQVVSTVFGSIANEANAEWTNVAFNNPDFQSGTDYGKISTKAAVIGEMNYNGVYSGTVSSTDVIYVRIADIASGGPQLSRIKVSYKENAGTVITQTLDMALGTTAIQVLTITPGFTDGATLSELSVSITENDDTAVFDNLRLYDFLIGPNPTLSLKSNVIEGAFVIGRDGEITVKGAQLDAVYSITGQKVGAAGLSSGIYIVRISKDNKYATVKVAL